MLLQVGLEGNHQSLIICYFVPLRCDNSLLISHNISDTVYICFRIGFQNAQLITNASGIENVPWNSAKPCESVSLDKQEWRYCV